MAGTPQRTDFGANDLIQLPRFDAAGAIALGEKLLAVAAEVAGQQPGLRPDEPGYAPDPGLPRGVQRARDALEVELGALRDAAAARLAARAAANSSAGPTQEAVESADNLLDTCWTALYEWLTGFAKLPDLYAESVEARALLMELYPDGLSFILLPYELEWGQSDQRLGRIGNEALGERLKKLGGGVFIEALQTAHWEYGKLLGLPRLPDTGDDRPSTAQALERFASVLRVYALKVTAQVEVDEPATADLAKRLLDPLMHWKMAPRTVLDVEKTFYP